MGVGWNICLGGGGVDWVLGWGWGGMGVGVEIEWALAGGVIHWKTQFVGLALSVSVPAKRDYNYSNILNLSQLLACHLRRSAGCY